MLKNSSCVHTSGRQVCYQEALPKVIGTDNVNRNEVMMLECQISQLLNEVRRRCLAQDLVHLHGKEATAFQAVCISP